MSNFVFFAAFCKSNHINKAQVAPFTNKETGEEFKSLVLSHFIMENKQPKLVKRYLVGFGKSLGGPLSPAEIKRRTSDLKIAIYGDSENPKYRLCTADTTWEDVELEFLEGIE